MSEDRRHPVDRLSDESAGVLIIPDELADSQPSGIDRDALREVIETDTAAVPRVVTRSQWLAEGQRKAW